MLELTISARKSNLQALPLKLGNQLVSFPTIIDFSTQKSTLNRLFGPKKSTTQSTFGTLKIDFFRLDFIQLKFSIFVY